MSISKFSKSVLIVCSFIFILTLTLPQLSSNDSLTISVAYSKEKNDEGKSGNAGGSGSANSHGGQPGQGEGEGNTFGGSPGKGDQYISDNNSNGAGFLGGVVGKIKNVFSGIANTFKGIFSGSGRANNNQPIQEFPGGSDDWEPSPTTNSVDLVPETKDATVTGDITVFLGQVKVTSGGDRKATALFVPQDSAKGDVLGVSAYKSDRTPTEANDYVLGSDRGSNDSGSGTQITGIDNELLIDYSCDGTVEETEEFTTPYKTLVSGNDQVIPLSKRMTTGAIGSHCFIFKIDTKNVVKESNENNNQTDWHRFEVENVATSTNPVIPENIGVECRQYAPPPCEANEELVSLGTLENGCSAGFQCIATAALSPEDINLKVKSYKLSTTGGVPVYTIGNDWTSQDIVVEETDKLHFSWEAHAYSQCLTYLHPVRYDFSSQVTSNTGNTETLNEEIKTLNDTYAVECSTGENDYRQEIKVTVE